MKIEINPVPFEEFVEEFLNEPKNKKAYDELEPEFRLLEAILKRRKERGITQKELATRMKTQQSAIARLEKSNYNPSFKTLNKIAKALDSELYIEFRPSSK